MLSSFTGLRDQLKQVLASIHNYQHPTYRYPILDATFEDRLDDVQHVNSIPGLRAFRESVTKDLQVLDRYLANPAASSAPPSTNALYFIAVWKEVLHAPLPVVAIGKVFDASKSQSNSKHTRLKPSATTIKADVVAAGGREWIRVSTLKNARMLAEFREIDSYCTDSSSDSDNDVGRPSLAPTVFDNSLLRSGRSLIQAISANPLPDGSHPRLTLCLTRLDPTSKSEKDYDSRIGQTLDMLKEMGVTVRLGEQPAIPISSTPTASTPIRSPCSSSPSPSSTNQDILVSKRINLDLSLLVALVSDLTHSQLPTTIEEAEARFTPGVAYHAWKASRILAGKAKAPDYANASAKGTVAQTRALALQAMQEVRHGIIEEIRARLDRAGHMEDVEFWTSAEARTRCLRIVGKIGGPTEKRRAAALLGEGISPEKASEAFWSGSRWPTEAVRLLPIQILPEGPGREPNPDARGSSFRAALGDTCAQLLAAAPVPDPRDFVGQRLTNDALIDGTTQGQQCEDDGEIGRARVVCSNTRLTAHTVRSMAASANEEWTTLTANKGSVREILKEMRNRAVLPLHDGVHGGDDVGKGQAVLWILEPRSLAEGMRTDYTDK